MGKKKTHNKPLPPGWTSPAQEVVAQSGSAAPANSLPPGWESPHAAPACGCPVEAGYDQSNPSLAPEEAAGRDAEAVQRLADALREPGWELGALDSAGEPHRVAQTPSGRFAVVSPRGEAIADDPRSAAETYVGRVGGAVVLKALGSMLSYRQTVQTTVTTEAVAIPRAQVSLYAAAYPAQNPVAETRAGAGSWFEAGDAAWRISDEVESRKASHLDALAAHRDAAIAALSAGRAEDAVSHVRALQKHASDFRRGGAKTDRYPHLHDVELQVQRAHGMSGVADALSGYARDAGTAEPHEDARKAHFDAHQAHSAVAFAVYQDADAAARHRHAAQHHVRVSLAEARLRDAPRQ